MTRLIDIVSSQGKAALFRLLFGLGQPEVHLRELARQSGLALGTVQQELKRLAAVEIVGMRRDGNRTYFFANREHPIFPELCSLVLKTDGLAAVLGEALAVPEVGLAFVFGSVARGEASARSDVDLIVIGSIGLRRLSQLLAGVGERIGREINPHIFTASEFSDRRRRGEHFLKTVLASEKVFVKGSPRELEAVGKQRLGASAQDQPTGNS